MFGPSFGQQSSYNYFPNNEENYNKNSWNSQQVNGAGRRGYDDGYYRGNDKQRAYGNDGIKVSFPYSFAYLAFFELINVFFLTVFLLLL